MEGSDRHTGAGYSAGQLAKALFTAAAHEDAATRERAGERVRRWAAVLGGTLSGRLTVGSRTPVADLPAWVTPEVVRGGFATGTPAAGGPLTRHEAELAARAGVRPERKALFAHHLTEEGLAGLGELLDGGAYRVEFPEEAALPVVAWLLRAGDREGALEVLEAVSPYAGLLRFAPAPADAPPPDPEVMWRETAGEARDGVSGCEPNARVETMREALTVWNPFADELLALWLDTAEDGRVGARTDGEWRDRAAALLARYRELAAAHTRCAKHRKPKENLAILRSALEETVAGRALTPRAAGLLQRAVDSMVARRGRPGEERHAALRARQAAEASIPAHHLLARVVVARLADLPPDHGIRDVEAVLAPAREGEAPGVPAGTPIPPSIARVVRRAYAGTAEELIEAGVVPSAEVLATLVPRIAAAATAAPYADDALRSLMAANYLAFRRRRSLLLLNLEHQVRLDELPWVRAAARHRAADAGSRDDAHAALRRLGELALDAFPGTLPPNPFVRELAALSEEAGERLPWVEELAADIFMGTFSGKFPAAAKIAGELLRGGLYERYYGIDYAAVAAVPDVRRGAGRGAATSAEFDRMCGSTGSWGRPAENGVVIENAQILTTHNLATLVLRAGARPAAGWRELALRAFATAVTLTGRVRGNPRPLSTIKDAAYAWRHMIFFLSLPGAGDPLDFADELDRRLAAVPAPTRARLTPAVAGLRHVAAGGEFAPDGTAGEARRLRGWTTTRHWMAAAP
ncbi:hypothetical protein [Bailinhaonella thermotolerans]|uniref:Uncharacterized protein n=1 Tax=Bailinhaonella thermotolerans TaxID=1070861 RepID=A0A3A4AVM5_9ACTN|nr:hypothetical protein [Bailinhaonella thermotolerans]RJL31374.1 hypothetical protein D5H75_20245 [Bailinhaonella thermotolerans]